MNLTGPITRVVGFFLCQYPLNLSHHLVLVVPSDALEIIEVHPVPLSEVLDEVAEDIFDGACHIRKVKTVRR